MRNRRVLFLERENERLSSENAQLKEEIAAIEKENESMNKIVLSYRSSLDEIKKKNESVVCEYKKAANEARDAKKRYEELAMSARMNVKEYEKKFDKILGRMKRFGK